MKKKTFLGEILFKKKFQKNFFSPLSPKIPGAYSAVFKSHGPSGNIELSATMFDFFYVDIAKTNKSVKLAATESAT